MNFLLAVIMIVAMILAFLAALQVNSPKLNLGWMSVALFFLYILLPILEKKPWA